MSFLSNLHAHTKYCDGKNDAEEYIIEAISQGFKSVGLSGHSYMYFDEPACMSQEGTLKYVDELKMLKEKYKNQIEVYVGIEADYYSGYNKLIDKNFGFEYRIGSVHYVKSKINDTYYCVDNTPKLLEQAISEYDNGDVSTFICAYYDNIIDMIITQKPDILGHLDLPKKFNKDYKYFDESSDWYTTKIDEVLNIIKENGTIVELNTGGISRGYISEPYPSKDILRKIKQLGIPVTISSDAHESKNLSFYFQETVDLLKELGFSECKILLNGIFQNIKL